MVVKENEQDLIGAHGHGLLLFCLAIYLFFQSNPLPICWGTLQRALPANLFLPFNQPICPLLPNINEGRYLVGLFRQGFAKDF